MERCRKAIHSNRRGNRSRCNEHRLGRSSIMKHIVLATALLLVVAFAAPSIVISSADAKITQTNGGGNTPGGNANGVPHENPAGKEPPGQNKKSTGNPN